MNQFMPDRYAAAKKRHHDLSVELVRADERLTKLRQEAGLMWQAQHDSMMIDPRQNFVVDEIRRGEELIAKLIELLHDVEKALPCDAFAERFGWTMHDLYREKYPINRLTKVQELNLGSYHPVYYLAIPDPEPVSWFDDKPPTYVSLKRRELTLVFEMWGMRDTETMFSLCYCAELDTVFTQERL